MMGIGPMELIILAVFFLVIGLPLALVVWIAVRWRRQQHAEILERLERIERRLPPAG
jgi:sensor domain CHASE-containing protein